MMRQLRSPRRAQRGTALIVSLVLLLVLTILGISSMRTSGLQERMAGNLHDAHLAFQAAEAALREAERFLGSASLPEFTNSNGLYVYDPTDPTNPDPVWKDPNWHLTKARVYEGTLNGVSTPPRYVIEELPTVTLPGQSAAADEPLPEMTIYRVTAWARGGSDASEVILQSTYMR
ncbi:MAG: pilus assembly protein [Xanthomonadaceae bacterium]|nr:pilus assembly protein [Xanthomonadaceae bacterium]